MKGKKVLKILVAAIMVTTFIAQVVAMADTDYTTSTTYNAASGKAEVTTSVTGVNLGDEVTFLVKRSSDILYIDQTNAAQGTASFTFLTPVANADSTATVEVGTSTSGKVRTALATDTITLSQGTVTYSVVGGGDVFVGAATTASTSGSANKYPSETITFYFAPNAGYELGSVAVNGAAQGGVTAADTSYVYTVSGNAALTFTFVEKSPVTDVTATIASEPAGETGYEATTIGSTTGENAMTSFATIGNSNAAIEYGIVVSKSYDVLDAITSVDGLTSKISNVNDTEAVYKFKAYGSYNGAFGVQLVDGGKGYLVGTVYSKTYVVSDNGNCNFGAIAEHSY